MKSYNYNFVNGFIKKYLITILICSVFSLQASEQPEYYSGDKRPFSEKDQGEGLAFKRARKDEKSSDDFQEPLGSSSQIYSIPTYDATFKYMLSDSKICLSFLRTFALNSDIESIEKLDEHLRPVQSYQTAQFVINDQKSKKLMEKIDLLRKSEEGIEVVTTDSKSITNGGWFLTSLSEIYGDILSAFPTPERNSTVDILCRLHDGSYALVEVQVVEQDYWDRRALAYAASVYSQQMRKSDKWEKLKSVICINIWLFNSLR